MNSDILKPTIELSTTEDVPPKSNSYKTQIEAFRTNPGGYQGFNIYKISKDVWNRRTTTNFDYLESYSESLFKAGEFHHSELPYEVDNISWVLKKGDDLLLWPRLNFFHSANAAFVVTPSNRQAISVKLPYYEYVVDKLF